MHQSDHAVRLAAFRFLEEQVRLSGEEGAIRRSVLERGFVLDGERVPLLGPQGIFKPRVLEPVRLSFLWRPMLPDANDDMVLETAVNGRADLLVTFNRRHFEAAPATFGIAVESPAETVRRLRGIL